MGPPVVRQGIRSRLSGFSVEAIVETFVVFFGLWTLTTNIIALVGGNFRDLEICSLIPLVTTVLLSRKANPKGLHVVRYDQTDKAGQHPPFEISSHSALLALLAILNVGLFAWTGSRTLLWGIGVLLLFYNLIQINKQDQTVTGQQAPALARTNAWFLLAVIVAALSPITFKDWNPDDAFYLNSINTLLDHPDWAVQRFDGMHGEHPVGILLPAYWVHSYEPLIGWLSAVLHLDPMAVYYVAAPPFFSVLAVSAYWLVLRRFVRENAAVALAVSVFFLLLWPQSLGSWTGKAWLGILAVPALIHFALRFSAQPNLWNGFLLTMGQMAAFGFSSSGTIVGPLVVALILLSRFNFTAGAVRPIALGALTSIPSAVALGVIYYGIRARGGIGCDSPEQWLNTAGMRFLEYVGISCLFIAALLPWPATARGLRAAIFLVVFFVLFNPLVSHLMARISSGNMSWRIFWAFPLPLAAGIAAGCLLGSAGLRRKSAAFAICGVLLITVAVERNAILESWDYFTLNFAGYQVGPEWPAAKAAVRVTPKDGLILAAGDVAQWIPTIRHAPRLVVARPHYVACMANEFGAKEAKWRLDLFKYVDSPVEVDAQDSVRETDEIVKRGVTTIVMQNSAQRNLLAGALTRIGYASFQIAGYHIWFRPGDTSLAPGHESSR